MLDRLSPYRFASALRRPGPEPCHQLVHVGVTQPISHSKRPITLARRQQARPQLWVADPLAARGPDSSSCQNEQAFPLIIFP